jgi:hypothetical protein
MLLSTKIEANEMPCESLQVCVDKCDILYEINNIYGLVWFTFHQITDLLCSFGVFFSDFWVLKKIDTDIYYTV